MKMKRFVATDMREALRMVREQQGPEAVILSTRRTDDGLEVVSAVDYDETLIQSARAADRDGAGGAEPAAGARSGASGGERFVDRLRRARTGHAPAAPADEPVAEARAHSEPAVEDVPAAPDTQTAPDSGPARVTRGDDAMRDEINALRRMLESQLSTLAWHDFSRRSPVKAALLRDLIDIGVSPALAQDLVEGVGNDDRHLRSAWRRVLGVLAQRIPVVEGDPVEAGGTVALLGPTGVGKTTTVAKLAARYARRHGPESVAIVSADDHRVGAQEQIFSYGRMLDVPVYPAGSDAELQRRLERLAHARLVLVDTPGAPIRNGGLRRTLSIMESAGRGLIPYLVMAANAQREAMVDSMLVFKEIALGGVIVTKIDEAASLGGVISALVEQGRPLAYAADGQDVPENLRRASARNLVRRAVELKPDGRPHADEGALAQQLGGLAYAFG